MKSLLIIFGLSIPLTAASQTFRVQSAPPVEFNLLGKSHRGTEKSVRFFDIWPKYVFDTVAHKTYFAPGMGAAEYPIAVMNDYVQFDGFKAPSTEFTLDTKEAADVEQFIEINGRFFLLYSVADRKKDTKLLYVNEMSKDLVLLGTPVLIHTFTNIRGYGGAIFVHPSANHKFILFSRIIREQDDLIPRVSRQVECMVVDQGFSEVWYKMIEAPNVTRYEAASDGKIDDDGNLFMLASLDDKDNDKRPVIVTYFWKTKSFKSSPLGLPEGRNYGYSLGIIGGRQPWLMGLNYNNKTMSYVLGKMDPDSQTPQLLSSHEMPPEYAQGMSEKHLNPSGWTVSSIASLSGDNIVATIDPPPIVSTVRKVRFNPNTSQPIPGPSNAGHSDATSFYTLIISFDGKGTMNWSHLLRKIQFPGDNGGFRGSVIIPCRNKTFILYNDNPDNAKKSIDDPKLKVYRLSEVTVMVQEIDETGHAKKYPLTDDSGFKNFNLQVRNVRKVQNNLYYLPFTRRTGLLKSTARFATLKFE